MLVSHTGYGLNVAHRNVIAKSAKWPLPGTLNPPHTNPPVTSGGNFAGQSCSIISKHPANESKNNCCQDACPFTAALLEARTYKQSTNTKTHQSMNAISCNMLPWKEMHWVMSWQASLAPWAYYNNVKFLWSKRTMLINGKPAAQQAHDVQLLTSV